jgi:hypothetical protein
VVTNDRVFSSRADFMPIRLSCPQCKKDYQVPDSAAGKKGTCKNCGAVFQIPRADVSESPSGGKVLRHKEAAPFAAPKHEARHLEPIETHIRLHIGEIETVWHEKISDKVHLDVLVVPPSAQFNWYTLITSGMSDLPMQGADPEDRYAELVLCLPPTWKLSQQAFKDYRNYWPVEWLKRVARLPHEYQTWVGPGHTIPNGDPPEPFHDSTAMCCWMLAAPVWFPEEFRELRITPQRSINFLTMLPLYQSEVNYKLQHGAGELADRMGELQLTEVMRFDRPNVCPKNRLNLLPLLFRNRRFTIAGAVLMAVLFIYALFSGELGKQVPKHPPAGPPGFNPPGVPGTVMQQPNVPPQMLEHQKRVEEMRLEHERRMQEMRERAGQGPPR